MFTGPSMYGLADPIQFTARTLSYISTAVLELNQTYENEVLIALIEKVRILVAKEAFDVDQRIKLDVD
jgi:hypothetical protein